MDSRKVLNFGSLNVDYVYRVSHIVSPGENISAKDRGVFCGGKGLNRSVALSKSGTYVYHAGSIGADGDILLETLKKAGVNTDFISKQDFSGGHTIIQVDDHGQNCIIIYGGTNRMITKEHIDSVLKDFSAGDFLVLENEVSNVAYMIEQAYEKGMEIVFNPSPFDDSIYTLPLEKVGYFVLNELEAAELFGTKVIDETSRICATNDHDDLDGIDEIIAISKVRYPSAKILLTLGDRGSAYFDGSKIYRRDIFPVKAVDATAAGDTYLGYFVYGLLNNLSPEETIRIASKAASITVSRMGAADAIPTIDEIF